MSSPHMPQALQPQLVQKWKLLSFQLQFSVEKPLAAFLFCLRSSSTFSLWCKSLAQFSEVSGTGSSLRSKWNSWGDGRNCSVLLTLLGSKPCSQTKQNCLLCPWHGGSEGSWRENRTEAAWGEMGVNLILTVRGRQEHSPHQPGDETVKFSDSTERDCLSIKS